MDKPDERVDSTIPGGATLTPEIPSWKQHWPPVSYWAKVGIVLIAVFLGVRVLGILESILLVIAASLVVAVGLQPAITWLEGRGLKRAIAMMVLMVAGLLVVGALAFVLLPTIVAQVTNLVSALPDYLDRLESGTRWFARLDQRFNLMSRAQSIGASLPGTALALAVGIGNAIFYTIIALVLTPSFAYTLPNIKRWAVRLLVRDRREDFLFVLNRSTDLIANYLTGNLIVSLVAGVTSFAALSLIGVPYAVALAAFIAVADLIPVVGALIGAALAVAVAAFVGTPQLVATLIYMVVYQQVENHLIIPRVMNKAIDLSPAVVIISLLIGGTLAGLVGALLALPVAAMSKVIVTEFVLKERIEAVRAANAETRPSRFRRRGGTLGQRPLP